LSPTKKNLEGTALWPALSNAGAKEMANMLIPVEERNLTPNQVELLDKRRAWGLTLQVISGLLVIIGVILWLWVGQDLTYSPGWIHPLAYYDAIVWIVAIVLGTTGTALRKGAPEFN
jgi:hypothetical protein